MGNRTRKRKFWYEIRNGTVRVDTKEKTVMEQANGILEEITRSQVATMTRINGARPQRSKRLRKLQSRGKPVDRETLRRLQGCTGYGKGVLERRVLEENGEMSRFLQWREDRLLQKKKIRVVSKYKSSRRGKG